MTSRWPSPRCRRLLDLDADPVAVEGCWRRAARRPTWRAARAAGARRRRRRRARGAGVSVSRSQSRGPHVAGRLAAQYGRPLPAPCGGSTHAFPGAETLAAADPANWRCPRARARALVGLAAALAGGELVLDGSADRADMERRLLAPGIGPWTAGYIRMRALRDPDVWLGTDLEIVKALARLAPRRAAGNRSRALVTLAFVRRPATLVRRPIMTLTPPSRATRW